MEGLTVTDPSGIPRVREVSLVAAAGQLTAVLGPPGSGKTTLLRAISGALEAGYSLTGAISLGADSIPRIAPGAGFRAGLRYVGPDRRILPKRSVRDNLATPARLAQVAERDLARWLDRLIGYFPRLTFRLDQAAANLSLGEQQILGLAVEVAGQPRLLAVDRASAGVSPLSLPEVFRGLRQYAHDHQAVVVCAEENATALLREADQILILDVGRPVFLGSLEEFKASREARARLGLTVPRRRFGRAPRSALN